MNLIVPFEFAGRVWLVYGDFSRSAVFTLSGRMKAEQVAELKELFDTDYRSIILDLQEMRLADRDAVKFLRSCEREGMKLENCPAYVREWMDREED